MGEKKWKGKLGSKLGQGIFDHGDGEVSYELSLASKNKWCLTVSQYKIIEEKNLWRTIGCWEYDRKT